MIILGLSGEYMHDSAACIIKDGLLLSFAEEERFCQKKHAVGEIPLCSIAYCLDSAGITMDDLDCIAISWSAELIGTDIVSKLRAHPFLKSRKNIPIFSADNHQSLAAASYYLSGMDDALILVVNGSSDGVSTSISYAKNRKINMLHSLPASQSVGYFYTALGIYLGFDFWDESKVMGLAAYGRPLYEFPVKLTSESYEVDISSLPKENINQAFVQKWMHHFIRLFGAPNKKEYMYNKLSGQIEINSIQFSEKQKNIAASAQHTLENILLHLIKQYTLKTGCRNLIFSGGVAQNSSANGKIQCSGLVDNLFILPSPHASGGCIGAAMLAYAQNHDVPVQKLQTSYWGPNFTEDEIQKELIKNNIKYTRCDDIVSVVTDLLTENKVIGWFQGKCEMGPRTLGNRSIIANPANNLMHDRVNNEIKAREHWRPLATSILDDKRTWMLEDDFESPYMIKTMKAKQSIQNTIRSIVHVDGTVLPQTVTKSDNFLWYELISQFYKKTGIPALLHTSLNTKGKPICNSPINAIEAFYTCGLDMLAIGSFLIKK